MQITIDKKTGVFLAIIALLLATIASLAINRGDRDGNGMDENGMGGHMGHSSTSANYTGADIMFLQMMIDFLSLYKYFLHPNIQRVAMLIVQV